MKKLMMFLLVATIGTTTAMAQDSAKKSMDNMDHMKMKKDCVMMESGKMMMMKDGKTMAMDKDVALTNGATVMTDGTIKMADGTTKQLKEGEGVYMDGKMTGGKKGKMKKEM